LDAFSSREPVSTSVESAPAGSFRNACHQAMDRKFIVIAQPTGHPFTNQVFTPQGKK
jgi:hypothetical protein